MALLAVAGLAAVIASIPDLSERRRSNAERERQEEAACSAGSAWQADRALVAPRRAPDVRTVGALKAAITADVVKRERPPATARRLPPAAAGSAAAELRCRHLRGRADRAATGA